MLGLFRLLRVVFICINMRLGRYVLMEYVEVVDELCFVVFRCRFDFVF